MMASHVFTTVFIQIQRKEKKCVKDSNKTDKKLKITAECNLTITNFLNVK